MPRSTSWVSINLLEASVTHKVRRFVYISTGGAIYGEPKELSLAEHCPVNPITH
jgi:UDP-glucose 4-epimerase